MAQQAHIEILRGPSREDIRDSVGSKPDQRINVTFKLNGHARDVAMVYPLPVDRGTIDLVVLINGLEWEDGSGESFNLTGYAVRIVDQDELISRRFKAYYRTDKREGFMIFDV